MRPFQSFPYRRRRQPAAGRVVAALLILALLVVYRTWNEPARPPANGPLDQIVPAERAAPAERDAPVATAESNEREPAVETQPRPRRRRQRDLAPGVHRVERVVDGDTLLLETGARVRLIGVNCPESVRPDYPVEPWGVEASDFTKRFIEDANGAVRLEFDKQKKDEYDRYLAYVWSDDELLNEELLRAGFARALLRFDYSAAMKDRFRAAQREAQRAKRGIWSNEPAPSR